VLVGLCLGAALLENVAADRDGLQGSWTATAVENSGRKAEGAVVQVVVKDDTLKLFEDGKLLAAAAFRLQREGQSRLIDLAFSEGSVKGMTLEGIYALKGDDLTICFAIREKERPTEFASNKGIAAVLLVLKRD